eukprot:Rhum_TRINITY_DN14796_c17_g1::Rhum_TRINITY_DN14796_c17_g1_i1::g.119007::m.119007
MYGLLLIETTTGSPVFFKKWQDGFGLPEFASHVQQAGGGGGGGGGGTVPHAQADSADAAGFASNLRGGAVSGGGAAGGGGGSGGAGGSGSGRSQAITASVLLAALQSRCAAATGEGMRVGAVRADGCLLLHCDDVEGNVLGVLVCDPHLTEAWGARLLADITREFVAAHLDAVKLTATGVIRSVKKAMRPLLARAVWACLDDMGQSLLDAVKLLCPGCTFCLACYSPDLTQAILHPPSASAIKGMADVEGSMAGLLGRSVFAHDEGRAFHGKPCWFGDAAGSAAHASADHRTAALLRTVLATFRLHRLAGSASGAKRPTAMCHESGDGVRLHCVVWGDLYLAFSAPPPMHPDDPGDLNMAFSRQYLRDVAQPVEVLLKLTYDGAIDYPTEVAAPGG